MHIFPKCSGTPLKSWGNAQGFLDFWLQDFWSMFGYFRTLCITWLRLLLPDCSFQKLSTDYILNLSRREKCPNTDFFLVRIFPYSDLIRENADWKKLRILTLYTQCMALKSSLEENSSKKKNFWCFLPTVQISSKLYTWVAGSETISETI